MKILDIPRSGSYQAITSSRNRAGQYVRNRRSPVQPLGTGRRSFIRGAMGAASSAWGGLTDAQRAAWIGYADATPYVDRLGQSIKLTGHQIFVAIATQLLNCGQAISNVPPLDNVVPVLSDIVASADASEPLVNVDFASTGTAADFILVAYSPQVPAGRGYNGRWWQGGIEEGNATGSDNTTAYVAEFGTPAVGQRIFIKLTPVNQYGVTGAPTVVSTIVGA